MKKRSISLFLVMCLVALFGVSSIALTSLTQQNASAFPVNQTGTAQNPFVITTCAELQSLDDNSVTNALYVLDNDINCNVAPYNTGAGFNPISGFTGTLDGLGNSINGLFINRPTDDNVGLFDQFEGVLVTHVSIDSASSITGGGFASVGSFAGLAFFSKFVDVHSAATVLGANGNTGGIVGIMQGFEQNSATIEKSSFTGNVTSSSAIDGTAGGLIGFAALGWDITDSYTNATISGHRAGGLVGIYSGACGFRSIDNSYSSGTLNYLEYGGGLIGLSQTGSCDSSTITNSFSAIELGTDLAPLMVNNLGGLIGNNINTSWVITNSGYDASALGDPALNCLGADNFSVIVTGCTNQTVAQFFYNAGGVIEAPIWDTADVWADAGPLPPTLQTVPSDSGPTAPLNLVLTLSNRTDLNISWDPPSSPGTFAVNDYKFEIQEAGGNWDNLFDWGTPAVTSLNFYSLRLGTEYEVRVRANTDYAYSDWAQTSITTEDPIVTNISDCAGLQAYDDEVGNELEKINITSNIDCSGVANFVPIGNDPDGWNGSVFLGEFDGNGYTILNLNIDFSSDSRIGLFRDLEGAYIHDITLSGGSVVGAQSVGALAGNADNATIENVRSNINVEAIDSEAGGLVGDIEVDESDAYVRNVSSSGNVVAGDGQAGGLFGYAHADNESTFNISKSFATGNVTSNDDAGGLIGYAEVEAYDDNDFPPSEIIITDVYATGNVTANTGNAGGLIGYTELYNDDYETYARLTITNAYASGSVTGDDAGGLIGSVEARNEYSDLSITNSFVFGNVAGASSEYAIIGFADFDDTNELTYDNVLFDESRTTMTEPDEINNGGWTAVNSGNSQPNYFLNNNTNEPMASWNFSSVWVKNLGALPTFSVATVDSDADGISDAIENAAPNGGDANNDGIADGEQANVASFVSPITGQYVTIALNDECELQEAGVTSEGSKAVTDVAFDYPIGFAGFVAECSSNAQVEARFFNLNNANFVARKFNPNTNAYFTIEGATVAQGALDGLQFVSVSYLVADNGPLDLDALSGTIADPVGLGQQVLGAPRTGAGGTFGK